MTPQQTKRVWAAVGALVLVLAALWIARGPEENSSAPAPAGSASDAELETFLRARARILDIERQVRAVQKHPNAHAKPEVMQRLYDQANAAILDVLRSEGMTLARYNDLQRQLNGNPQELKRAQKLIQRLERRAQRSNASLSATTAAATTATAAVTTP